MPKVKNEMVRCVVVLSAIALIAGVLLGFFSQLTALTEEDIRLRTEKKIAAIYSLSNLTELEGAEDDNIGGFYKGSNESGDVYVVIATGAGGFGGKVQMYVFIQNDQIVRLGAGSHGETPGTSDKAFSGTHYQKYYGVNILENSFALGGEGEYGVDAMTGATYTSTAVNNAVNNAIAYYRANR